MIVFEKIRNSAKSAADRARDSREIGKLNARADECVKQADEAKRELAEYFYRGFCAGEQFAPEAAELCERVRKALDEAEKLGAEAERIRTEREDEIAARDTELALKAAEMAAARAAVRAQRAAKREQEVAEREHIIAEATQAKEEPCTSDDAVSLTDVDIPPECEAEEENGAPGEKEWEPSEAEQPSCPDCGSPLIEGMKFCGQCGAKLTE